MIVNFFLDFITILYYDKHIPVEGINVKDDKMNKIIFIWKKYAFLLLFIFLPLVALVDYRFGLAALFCIVMPIFTSFFMGKYWCGNLCPRGSLFDQVVIHLSEEKKTPIFFQTITFRIIIIIVTIYYFYDGINHYGGSLDTWGYLLCKFILMTTVIAALLTTFFNERTWCSFCPVGTLASLNSRIFNRFNKKHLLKVGENCSDCKQCDAVCPMNVKISNYKNGDIMDMNCLACGKCQDSCQLKQISR